MNMRRVRLSMFKAVNQLVNCEGQRMNAHQQISYMCRAPCDCFLIKHLLIVLIVILSCFDIQKKGLTTVWLHLY